MIANNNRNSTTEENAQPLHTDRVGPFILLPVVHHSYEFALAVRAAFEQFQPAAVAVEYPFSFRDLVLQAIRRLPRISILIYGEAVKQYIRIEPVDAFVEAARSALERDLPVICMDLAAPEYPEIEEPVPDPYAVAHIGHRDYCRLILDRQQTIRLDLDFIRERAMAYRLQDFVRRHGKTVNGPVLVLCGLSHLYGLKNALETERPQPFERQLSARIYHLSPRSLGEIMGFFPFFTAVYEKQRSGILVKKGQQAAVLEDGPLQVLAGDKPQNLIEYAIRAQDDTALTGPDRREILTRYLLWCRSYFERETGDRINPQQIYLLQNFSRKYAAIKQMLLPNFFEFLVSGRGCVNSHFCYRMWEIGTVYPPQEGPSELETIDLRAEDIFPLIQKVRMNPHAPLKPRSPLPRFLRRAEKQQRAKDLKLRFDPFSICSYQPEDLAIEGYGAYLRTKGKGILSEERKRVRPFEASLLDGIDLRETVRNWHTGKIFVQECMPVKGSVDSIVVIFDEDGTNYPCTMTWLGEHHQESDMAFYATDPDQRPAGPGIKKAVYGGFLMTMPPGRLFDVFGDPAYQSASNYAERLLLAGIDYGLERFVLYAAVKPPRPLMQVVAGRYGKRILYIPLAQLSPVMLQKIRTFHILAGKSVREYAKDYIW